MLDKIKKGLASYINGLIEGNHSSKENQIEETDENKNVKALKELLSKPVYSYFSDIKKSGIIKGLLSGDDVVLLLKSTKQLDLDLVNAMELVNPTARIYFIENAKPIAEKYLQEENKTLDELNSYPITYYTAYKFNEVKAILKKFEEIESFINPKWSQMQKFAFLYNYVLTNISYDDKYEQLDKMRLDKKYFVGDLLNRSLRCVVSNRAVCLGYSLVLDELLRRQNIASRVCISKTHAWVVAKIDDKFYNVEITSDSSSFHRGVDKSAWIGKTYEEFSATENHNLTEKFKYQDKDIEFSVMDKAELKKAAEDVVCPQNITSLIREITLKDGTQATLIPVGDLEKMFVTFYAYLFEEKGENKAPRIIYSSLNFEDYLEKIDYSSRYNFCTDEPVLDGFNKDDLWKADSRTYIFAPELVDGKLVYSNIYDEVCDNLKRLQNNFTEFRDGNIRYIAIPRDLEDISKTRDPYNADIISVYDLYKFDNTDKRNRGVVYHIRTERGLYSYKTPAEKEAVVKKLFSESNLKDAIKFSKGYIGCLEQQRGKFEVVKNPEFLKFYDSTKQQDDPHAELTK